ncbi:hypothetical protein AXG93_1640s1020 [Marchantia polymorpha subsp. ruderalis]|uniref:Uncharacterized protein n=1 Tax=Marchantia polymorpha subsp. ruderalis TaxID=1480154 RepID=A0A176WCW9_MARPO|nr:hypothetical protein AXG93_1640s1020 [Marchantia polymorpha subsp. ruderalis]
MTEGATSTTDEDTKEEVNLWTAGVGTSGIHNEDPIEEDVEPSEQRTATTSQGSGAHWWYPEIPLPQASAGVDSVVPLLKYLDGKQENYAISKKVGFYVKLVKNKTHIKRAATLKTAEEMKKECAEATAKEREEHLQAKLMECEVLWLNLVKEKELRAKDELRTKDLWWAMAAMKTERMELHGRIEARTKAHNKELQRANELMASLVERMKKHEVELANWKKRLMDCGTPKSFDVECRLKLDANCNRL